MAVLRERLRLALATGLGVGLIPWAPGTFGSLPGLVLHVALTRAGGPPAVLAGIAVVIALGLWSAGAGERRFGRRDPGAVVIDEVAGQMLALAWLPATPSAIALGFLAFRLFDVLKPPPLRRLETLPGAAGIMADDLGAGIYANATVRLAIALMGIR